MPLDENTDIRPFLDDIDHNNIYATLTELGLLSNNRPVTVKMVDDLIGGGTSISGFESPQDFLDHASRIIEKSPPEVSPPVRPRFPSTDRELMNKPMPIDDFVVKPDESEFTPPPFTPSQNVEEKFGAVLTTERVEFSASSSSNTFADQKAVLPTSAPILIYILIGTAIAGALWNIGTPNFIAIPLGLAFAAAVPAFMPSHPVNRFLAGISTVAWLVIMLGMLIGLDTSEYSDVTKFILDSPMLISLNFLVLTAGITLLEDPIWDEQKWTRIMGNNITLLSLFILMMAMIIPDINSQTMYVIMGTLVGLWGIVILGDNYPLDLTKAHNQLAIVCLALAFLVLFTSWEGDIFVFTIVGILIVGFAILAPTVTNEELGNFFLLASVLGIISFSFIVTGLNSEYVIISLAIHLLVLFVTMGQLELRYRKTGKKDVFVEKILAPGEQSAGRKIHDIDSDIAVLGFKGAGKTSFLGALWLLLEHHVSRDLWYGSAKYLNDNRALGYSVEDLKLILQEVADSTESVMLSGDNDKEILLKYLSHRWAKSSMKKEFDEGKLPDSTKGFPFEPQTNRKTRKFLEGFISPLTNKDRSTRVLPESTAKVSDILQLTVSFDAELNESYHTWFGMRKKKRKFTSTVRNQIQSMDVPGEEVQRAVEFMDGKRIKSKSVQGLLKNIESHEEFGDHREAIRYIVKMTATFGHVIFLIDADNFTRPGRDQNSPVAAYLRLANELAHLNGAALKKITILLNKSDVLLIRSEVPNRTMPNGGLSNWDQILDDKLARETLEEVVGPATLNRIQVPIDVHFAATFGGLIHRGGSDNSDDVVPTYPMVPINVIEPVIRSIMPDDQDQLSEV